MCRYVRNIAVAGVMAGMTGIAAAQMSGQNPGQQDPLLGGQNQQNQNQPTQLGQDRGSEQSMQQSMSAKQTITAQGTVVSLYMFVTSGTTGQGNTSLGGNQQDQGSVLGQAGQSGQTGQYGETTSEDQALAQGSRGQGQNGAFGTPATRPGMGGGDVTIPGRPQQPGQRGRRPRRPMMGMRHTGPIALKISSKGAAGGADADAQNAAGGSSTSASGQVHLITYDPSNPRSWRAYQRLHKWLGRKVQVSGHKYHKSGLTVLVVTRVRPAGGAMAPPQSAQPNQPARPHPVDELNLQQDPGMQPGDVLEQGEMQEQEDDGLF